MRPVPFYSSQLTQFERTVWSIHVFTQPRPVSALFLFDAYRPGATPPSAQLFQAHRQPQCQDSEQCSPASYVPAKAGRLANSWSADRSVSPSFAALCGCHKPLHPAQSIPPSGPQCARTSWWTDVATWLPCSERGTDRRCGALYRSRRRPTAGSVR
jgi:hypothetical protein